MNDLQRAFRRAMTVHTNERASRFPGGVYVVERDGGRFVVATDGRRMTAVRVAVGTPVGVWDHRDDVRKFLKPGGTLSKPTEVSGEKTYWYASPLPKGWDAILFNPPEPSWVVDVNAHELRRWVAGPFRKGVLVNKDDTIQFEWDNGLVIRAYGTHTVGVSEAAVEIPAELVDAGTLLQPVNVPALHVTDALHFHPKKATARISFPITQENGIRFEVGDGDDITLVAKIVNSAQTRNVPTYSMGRP